jgi:hypothetical protein
VRFADEGVWLAEQQIAEIYAKTQQNIDLHIKNIYKDDELLRYPTYKEFLLIRIEHARQIILSR